LSEEKQALQLLALLDHLPAHYQLHVIGDGPLMADMQQQGKPHLALGRLHLHGHQRVDANTFVGWQATVLCSAYEGYPMTALESLSCKVPCVSTPIAAMQEMLATHAPYMLASDTSPQALAKAIEATLATPPEQRRQDMDALIQQHTPEQFVQLWDQVLQQAIARKRMPGDTA
jgi:glycosyltransferase involved in cell wall biosynthesis